MQTENPFGCRTIKKEDNSSRENSHQRSQPFRKKVALASDDKSSFLISTFHASERSFEHPSYERYMEMERALQEAIEENTILRDRVMELEALFAEAQERVINHEDVFILELNQLGQNDNDKNVSRVVRARSLWLFAYLSVHEYQFSNSSSGFEKRGLRLAIEGLLDFLLLNWFFSTVSLEFQLLNLPFQRFHIQQFLNYLVIFLLLDEQKQLNNVSFAVEFLWDDREEYVVQLFLQDCRVDFENIFESVVESRIMLRW